MWVSFQHKMFGFTTTNNDNTKGAVFSFSVIVDLFEWK